MSGFVGKLFAMVNESPNDIVDWLPSGDAFQILDLERLESQTLPLHFRHSRFQSLVRQLNFYNFRKVNRERTFWVYKHPLFHRDKPELLPLLRRKTCPGVDGRRSAKDEPPTTGSSSRGTEEKRVPTGTRSSARVGRPPRNHDAYTPVVSVTPHSFASGSSTTDTSASSTSTLGVPGRSVQQQQQQQQQPQQQQQQQQQTGAADEDAEFPGYGHLGSSAHNSRSTSPTFDLSSSFDEAYGSNKRKAGAAANCNNRAERSERNQMVASVSQQLEAYAKRARTASGNSNGLGSGRTSPMNGLITAAANNNSKKNSNTPQNNAIRFHSLTYDDDEPGQHNNPSASEKSPLLHPISDADPSRERFNSSPVPPNTPGLTYSSTPIATPSATTISISSASSGSNTPLAFGSNFSSSFNQIPKTPSSAFCPKLTISLPTNPATDAHPSIHESSPHYATLSKCPITDLSLSTMIASKISKISPETNAALTKFCLSTPPTAILDPKTKGERLQELFSKDDRVKEDFNRYRDALSPRSSLDWCGRHRTGAPRHTTFTVKSEEETEADAMGAKEGGEECNEKEERNKHNNKNNAVTLELDAELTTAEGSPSADDTTHDGTAEQVSQSSHVAAAVAAAAAAATGQVDPKDFTPFCINHLRDTFKEGYEKHGFTEREVEAVENAIKVWFRAAMVTQ